MNMINNRFGILLAEKRMNEKRRIPLSEVAKVTGISRGSLQAWENNTVTRIDFPILNALCVYFDVQPGDLFHYVKAESRTGEVEVIKVSQIKKTLPPKGSDRLGGIISISQDGKVEHIGGIKKTPAKETVIKSATKKK